MTVRPQAAAGLESGFRFQSSLSVFFPAYNDAPSLPGLIRRTFETLRRLVGDFEVIVINDGSQDATGAVLERLRQEYAPHLRVVTHEKNLGYGAALRRGFLEATKEYIFYTDGDGQYDPGELEKLLLAAEPEAGLVNGYKIQRHDPWHRIAIGWLYNQFARWLFRVRLRDIDCDFRLIRRSAFDPAKLQSTSGTICVELVRNLELSGTKVIEVPVNHFARQHGRSQFFRLQSLLKTFIQLCRTYWRVVLAPCFSGSVCLTGLDERRERLSGRKIGFLAACIGALSFLAYARALWLPFISDDYVQIMLGRDYGPVSKWGALAHDALYRCRATSIVLTYWLERGFGLEPIYYNLGSLLLHFANSLLVLALGFWRPIGWRMAALAACFFAISQRHSEAVIWFAALPELLVFTFVLATVVLWTLWLDRGGPGVWTAALGAYVLALLSKESAVAAVPLCALGVLCHPGRPWRRLWGLVPFAAMAGIYFGLIYASRDSHLHFHDGTFSLQAPVGEVMLRSAGGLLWFWGAVALILFATGVLRARRGIVPLSLAWMIVSLLPYSFLTYMPRVPSRHTYLASVGLSLIVASAFLAFRERAYTARRRWLVPVMAALIGLHQCGYIWIFLHRKYELRAQPTQKLLEAARQNPEKVYANCFPYSPVIAEYALLVTIPEQQRPKFELGPEAAKQAAAQDFCNAVAEGVRY